MDPLSLTVGALSIIAACAKCGTALIKLYDDHVSADVQMSETLLKLKTIWHKAGTQMTFLERIWSSLDLNFQTTQALLLSTLERKLQEAMLLLTSVLETRAGSSGLYQIFAINRSLRRGKYVLLVKDSLNKTVADLIEWYDLFNPSWYLISRVVNNEVDRSTESNAKDEPIKLLGNLRKSVRELSSSTNAIPRPISTRDFLSSRFPIRYSSAAVGQIQGRAQYTVVDKMPVNPYMHPAGTTRSVVALSKALSRMDPSTFGLLRCCGVINKIDSYEFIFEIPQEFETVRSLRDLLIDNSPSLNTKLQIAKQIATSVFYLHTVGFVHKNIRPETILVLNQGENIYCYLVGFESFRAAQDDTFKISDGLPERDLYRHPSRQGENPERRYVMQHDIYSLGVCLLEIGMWESFLEYNDNDVNIRLGSQGQSKDARRRALAMKQHFMEITDENLSRHVGDTFKSVVKTCLECLDENTTWSQANDQAAQEINVGVEFIENVLSKLQEIVV